MKTPINTPGIHRLQLLSWSVDRQTQRVPMTRVRAVLLESTSLDAEYADPNTTTREHHFVVWGDDFMQQWFAARDIHDVAEIEVASCTSAPWYRYSVRRAGGRR